MLHPATRGRVIGAVRLEMNAGGAAAQKRTLQGSFYGSGTRVPHRRGRVAWGDLVVRGFGYAPPLWAARSASKRRTCSSGATEPGVVSCRRIASLTALVAAAADSSPSVWSRRGWFGVSFT